MKDFISVIVPVYNVEVYLPQCLDSILSQDYEKLEVILIDDGSPDHCGAICDEYARRDSRVRVIHQKNAGAAAAKNAGLRVASGEYLSFVDSDDFLEPGAYSYMRSLMERFHVDVVQCAFRDVYRSRCEDVVLSPEQRQMTPADYLLLYTGPDWSAPLLWDKLYKRELFRNVWFEEGHKIDDEYFTYRGIMNAKKILRDNRVVYNYRRRASGVMLSVESQKRIALDRADYISKRRKHVSERFPELREEFNHHFLCTLVFLSGNKNNSPESMAKIQSALKEYLADPEKTRISPRLWPALLKLRLASPACLLKLAFRETVNTSIPEDLFA